MYVQSDTLSLVDLYDFENFRNLYIKIYLLDPTNYFSASGLAWQAALKNPKVKLGILLILVCY